MGSRSPGLHLASMSPLLLALMVAAVTADLADIADISTGGKQRNPKLFFVSSTTTTISTTTLCFISTTTSAACKRKRRALLLSGRTEENSDVTFDGITKTSGVESSRGSEEVEVSEGMKDARDEYDREGKFLLYWKTTTSTSTSYTATTTVSSLECTPSGFTISNCTG